MSDDIVQKAKRRKIEDSEGVGPPVLAQPVLAQPIPSKDEDTAMVDEPPSEDTVMEQSSAAAAPLAAAAPAAAASAPAAANQHGLLNADDYATLAICDTVHDFWKERGRKDDASVTSGDSVVSAGRLESMRAVVEAVLKVKPGPPNQTPDLIIRGRTGITSLTSDFEWKVVRYFEDKLGLVDKQTLLTFEEILEKGIDVTSLGDCLELTTQTGLPIDSISLANRQKIGNFLLKYLAGSNAEVGANQVAFTFDAGEGPVGKIFADFDQVVNYLFPQNIADSAVTTIKSLQGRCVAKWPTNNVAKSNYFTEPGITLTYINAKFSRETPHSFSIKVEEGDKTATIAFSPTEKQGASVNYLADLMLSGGPTPPERGMVDLTNVYTTLKNNGLLLDLKRMGDHEQVIASLEFSECYLSTIDILCSLYARVRQKSCILHTPYTLRLYRFPKETNPQLQILRSNVFRAQRNLGRLAAIQDYLKNVEAQLSDLDKVMEVFRIGKTAQLKSGTSKILTEYAEKADPGDLALTVITRLLNYRMDDLYQRVAEIKAGIEKYKGDGKVAEYAVTHLPVLKSAVEQTAINEPAVKVEGQSLIVGGKDITAMNAVIEDYFKTMPTFTELEFPLDSSGKFVSVYDSVFTRTGDVYYLKRAGSISAFKFSCQPYKNMVDSLRTLIQMSRATRTTAQKFALETAEAFFASRDAEKEAFFDLGRKEVVEKASDIASPFDVKTGVPVMVERVFAELLPIKQGGGGAATDAVDKDIQADTAKYTTAMRTVEWDPLMYHDLDDLFAEICSIAATTVNSILMSITKADLKTVGAKRRGGMNNGLSEGESDTSTPATPVRSAPGTVAPPPTQQPSSAEGSKVPSRSGTPPPTQQTLTNKVLLMQSKYAEPINDTFREIIDRWDYGYNQLKNNSLDTYGAEWDAAAVDPILPMLESKAGEPLDKLILLTVFDNYRYIAWAERTGKEAGKVNKAFNDYYGVSRGVSGKYDSRGEWTQLKNNIDVVFPLIIQNTALTNELKGVMGGRRKTYRKKISKRRRHTYRRRR